MHTMYVDKPMQGHGLMQAIARVNHVFRDKPGGLVVDYLGLADQLKRALHTYTESGGHGETAIDQEEAVALLLEKYEICCGLFHVDRSLGHGQAGAAHDEAIRIRDDVGFFQATRTAIAKSTAGDRKASGDLDHAIRQIVSNAVASDSAIDIFAAAGLKNPDISILSDQFLAELRGMPHKNLAVELLRKLLNDEVKSRSRHNLVQSRSFAELEGGAREESYVRAPVDRAAIVRFSDDTVVRAEPAARLRVEYAGAHRARSRRAWQGERTRRARRDARLDVRGRSVRSAGHRDTFHARLGTLAGEVELSLTEGSVEIRGPKGAGPVVVRAGQRFQGDGLRGSMRVDDAGQASSSEQNSPQAPSSAEPSTFAPAGPALVPALPPTSRLDAPASEPRKRPIPVAPESWQRRITRGDFVGIVQDAERRGVGQCLTSCSAPDLRALTRFISAKLQQAPLRRRRWPEKCAS